MKIIHLYNFQALANIPEIPGKFQKILSFRKIHNPSV